MKEFLFEDIKEKEWKFIEITPQVRLFYDLYECMDGFKFIALQCTGYECDGKNEYNFAPRSSIEILIHGIAYFDGIRHLYFGDERTDNFGYHYYPNLPELLNTITELRKLEIKYCK